MTTTVTGAKLDVHAVIKRADHRYAASNGDDDAPTEYITALVNAVRPLVEPAAPAVADPVEVQRLQDLVDELRRHVEGHARTIDRQKGEISALKMERQQLQATLDEARADTHARVDKAAAAGRLEAEGLRDRITDLRIELAAARNAASADHVHGYPLNPSTGDVDPCTCGLRYPRDTLAAHQDVDDDRPDEEEPISVLFGRLRLQLAGWGQA